MRIGVLTFHRCINYGSYWQTRCLVEGLRARGHEPVVIDHVSRRVDIAEWRCAFRPTLPEPAPPADRRHYRTKIRRFGKAVRALPLSPPCPLEGEVDPQCDLVVVGSDEVWNLAHPWYGGCPLFYGQGLQAARLVSYAASFGNQDAQWALAPEQAGWLEGFDRISVRDGNSARIVERALGRTPDLVLDPCLQFPPDEVGADGDAADHHHGEQPDAPYIALYGHGFSPRMAAGVKDWARRRGLAVVSIGYRNAWADRQWLDAGPHAFARFMAGAEAVVTNFFHGCVFALVNARPFACEPTSYRSNKIHGLMQTVGGARHLFDPHAPERPELDAVLGQPLDAAIGERIRAGRQRSSLFLDHALAA